MFEWESKAAGLFLLFGRIGVAKPVGSTGWNSWEQAQKLPGPFCWPARRRVVPRRGVAALAVASLRACEDSASSSPHSGVTVLLRCITAEVGGLLPRAPPRSACTLGVAPRTMRVKLSRRVVSWSPSCLQRCGRGESIRASLLWRGSWWSCRASSSRQ